MSARHEFLVLIPPTTGVSTYRAAVARDLADVYPEVLGLKAPSYACRMEFFDQGMKRRDLDVLAEGVLEALIKAGVLKDDAAIDTLLTSRSTDGPAGFVRVTLVELDAVTKAAIAKTTDLYPWSDKTLRSYPEPSGGSGVVPLVGAVVDTVFAGLDADSLEASYGTLGVDYAVGEEWQLNGTDSATGMEWSDDSPAPFGGNLYPHREQRLVRGDRGADPDVSVADAWEVENATGVPVFGTARRFRRTIDTGYIVPDQCALRLRTDKLPADQDMTYFRYLWKFPSDHPVSGPSFRFVLWEVKLNDTEAKIEVGWDWDGSYHRLYCKLVRVAGDSYILLESGSPYNLKRTVTPTPTDRFTNGTDEIIFSKGLFNYDAAGAAPDLDQIFCLEVAFRLQDRLGAKQGGSAGPAFVWVATSCGEDGELPEFGTGEQRFYFEGQNMHDAFTGSAPSGAGIIFLWNLYHSGAIDGLDFYLGRAQMIHSWPANASTHPDTSGGGGGGGGDEVAPAFRASSSAGTDDISQTTVNIPKPTGTASGDLVILAVLVTNNATAGSWGAVTWPAGFTEQASIGADPSAWNKLHVATKVAGGSEPSTYDVTYGESGGPYRVIGAALAYQAPNATPLDVTPVTQNNASNTGSVVAPSITPSNANEKRLVTIYGISDGNATTGGRLLAPPGGQTERVEFAPAETNGSAYSRIMVADEVYESASATGTRSATISGGDCESMAISLLLRGKVP